jgi:hypothetical protein
MSEDSTVFRNRTRATKYQQKYALPTNFTEILKQYTRELLRCQPGDIYAWSANYFKEVALAEDPTYNIQQPPPDHYAPAVETELDMLAQQVIEVFRAMDPENTGRLYVHLIKRVLIESLSLTRAQSLHILSSPSTVIGDDGAVQYVPFTKHSIHAIVFFQQTQYEFPTVDTVDPSLTVHGMLKEELQDELMRVMQQVDAEGVGRLRLSEYRDALHHAALQFTERDINLLCVEAATSADGTIGYVQEVQNAFGLLSLAQSFTALDEQQE